MSVCGYSSPRLHTGGPQEGREAPREASGSELLSRNAGNGAANAHVEIIGVPLFIP